MAMRDGSCTQRYQEEKPMFWQSSWLDALYRPPPVSVIKDECVRRADENWFRLRHDIQGLALLPGFYN